MFSTKLGRVAHRAANGANAAVTTPNAAQCTSSAVVTRRPPGQRRHASSKTDSSASGGRTPPSGKPDPLVDPVLDQRTAKRVTRVKKPRAPIVPQPIENFTMLPVVPSTHHIPPSDICISSFFSLHRPLALGTTIPPPSTSASFNNIFDSRHGDPWQNGDSAQRRPEDVIYALQNTVESMENASQALQQDEGVRWETVHDNADSIPRQKNFQDLISQFRPFSVPPPPEPFPDSMSVADQKKTARRVIKVPQRQKGYSPSLIITEPITNNTSRSFTPTTTIIPVTVPSQSATLSTVSSATEQLRYRFAERMKQRLEVSLAQQSGRVEAPSVSTFVKRSPILRQRGMFLISVKRQRKLKMKKHKYKKLMKRTRNLRRRQDRV